MVLLELDSFSHYELLLYDYKKYVHTEEYLRKNISILVENDTRESK